MLVPDRGMPVTTTKSGCEALSMTYLGGETMRTPPIAIALLLLATTVLHAHGSHDPSSRSYSAVKTTSSGLEVRSYLTGEDFSHIMEALKADEVATRRYLSSNYRVRRGAKRCRAVDERHAWVGAPAMLETKLNLKCPKVGALHIHVAWAERLGQEHRHGLSVVRHERRDGAELSSPFRYPLEVQR